MLRTAAPSIKEVSFFDKQLTNLVVGRGVLRSFAPRRRWLQKSSQEDDKRQNKHCRTSVLGAVFVLIFRLICPLILPATLPVSLPANFAR